MSTPDPVPPRSAVRTVLEFLRSLTSNVSPEEPPQEPQPPQPLPPHELEKPILEDLQFAKDTLGGIKSDLVAARHKTLDDERALLRHRLTTANSERRKATDSGTQSIVESLFKEVRERAGALRSAVVELKDDAERKQKASEEFASIEKTAEAVLTPVGTAKGVVAAQDKLKKALDDYRTQAGTATGSDAQRLVEAVKSNLAGVEQAQQEEAQAKQKAREGYTSQEQAIALALTVVPGPQAVLNAQASLRKACQDYETKVDAATAEETLALVNEVVQQLRGAEQAATLEANAKLEVTKRFESIKDKVAAALVVMQQSSKVLTEAQAKLEKAREDYLSAAATGTAEQLDGLVKLVENTLPEVENARLAHANDLEKTRYYSRLKKSRPRIDAIDKAIADKKYGDPLLDPLKTKVDEFLAARLKVKNAQTGGKFAEANLALTELDSAALAVEKARLTALDTDIKGATTATKVKDLVDKLTSNEIAALTPDQHVNLLKTLRTSGGPITPDGTPDLYKARSRLYDHIPLQPECDRQDKEFRTKITDAFNDDKVEPDDPKYPDYKGKTPREIFELAKTNWATWSPDKQFTFLKYAAKKQCAVMGHPEPVVEQGLDVNEYPPRTCSNAFLTCGTKGCKRKGKTWPYYPSKATDCPDCNKPFTNATPCGEAWPNASGTGNCPNSKCGAVDSGHDCSFGGCDLGWISGAGKSTITLNPHANVVGDFRETFDTIMHENAHSYQLYLVQRYRDDKAKLFKEVPGAKDIEAQIQLWDENARGYVNDGSPTYNNQPVEIHAWRFGRKMAAKKLAVKTPLKPGEKPEGVQDLT